MWETSFKSSSKIKIQNHVGNLLKNIFKSNILLQVGKACAPSPCPPAVNALLMDEALLSMWLFSAPATDPETEVDMGPRQEKKSSDIGLL